MESELCVQLGGAAGEVTGSCTLISGKKHLIAVDLGLFQGHPDHTDRNTQLPLERPEWLDAMVITHAHADHAGRLPMLARTDFSAPIITTTATAELLPMLLRAAARLQRRLAREDLQRGDPPRPILFETEDVDRIMRLVHPVEFGQAVRLSDQLQITLHSAGHILGAASALIEIEGRRIVMSGDLGHELGQPCPPPTAPPAADLVIMECTRGDARDDIESNPTEQLAAVLDLATHQEQVIVCPTFALGRAHQLLYRLSSLSRNGRLHMPVFLDSMMASLTAPMHADFPQMLSLQAQQLLHQGIDPLDFPERKLLRNKRAARVLEELRGPAMILAGSGFADAGPIVGHLKRWLPTDCGRILLAGFCMPGTVSGKLADDPPTLRLHGQVIEVTAPIDRLNCFTGHADGPQLKRWLKGMPGPQPTVILHHGDPKPRTAMMNSLRDDGYTLYAPSMMEAVTC